LIDDTIAAARPLKGLPDVDKELVILLVHSEGALIVPAVQSEENGAGLIFLGTRGRDHEINSFV
jgi:hypothetical protein